MAGAAITDRFDVSDQVYDREFGLGRNLLRLLPEDAWDHQPLWAPDRSCCLVADVRLDNRADLARALALTAPESLPDSSLLLGAWLRWDAACLDHLLGAFAFAVWTPARQELFAARDHSGERPLHFAECPEFFAVSTMPRPLLALPGVSAEINKDHLISSLLLGKPDNSHTFFTGVQRLPQGHSLRVSPAGLSIRRYWHPNDAPPTRFQRDSEYPEALVEILDRATAARLRTNGSMIGSQLSAGLDSSTVTATAATLLGRLGQPLTAFTSVPRAGFHGKAPFGRLPDEGPGARSVARLYPNMTHLCLDTQGEDLLGVTHALSDALSEPVVNSVNALWLTRIMRLASERGISAMLMGARGNATFSYFGYEALNLWFRQGRWLHLALASYRMRRNGKISFKRAFSEATRNAIPTWLQQRMTPEGRSFSFDYSAANPRLLHDPAVRHRMVHDFFSAHRTLAEERADFFERVDEGHFNGAMRSLTGVDLRDPAGDKRVFDFCYSIPIEQYVVGDVPRSLVRRAMKDRLPAEFLDRTTRGIQGADWYMTVGEALPALRAALPALRQSPLAEYWLDFDKTERLLDTWPADGYEQWPVWLNYCDSLCRAYSYGYFLGRDHGALARGEVSPAPWIAPGAAPAVRP